MKSLEKSPCYERLLQKLIGPEPLNCQVRPESPLDGENNPEHNKRR